MNSNRDEHLVSIPLAHEPHSGLVSGSAVHYVGQAEVGLLSKSLSTVSGALGFEIV